MKVIKQILLDFKPSHKEEHNIIILHEYRNKLTPVFLHFFLIGELNYIPLKTQTF